MNALFLLWFAAAFDSRGGLAPRRNGIDVWRGFAYRRKGIVQASGEHIAFKEPAQVFASGMEAQFNGASVNGFFQLRRTAEAERDISTSGDFFDGHKVIIQSYLMNNSQERNPEIQGQDLGHWMNQLSGYPPLETRALAEGQEDGPHHRMSVSVPPEIKAFVTQRAKQLGLSRSHYIRLLVKADIAKE